MLCSLLVQTCVNDFEDLSGVQSFMRSCIRSDGRCLVYDEATELVSLGTSEGPVEKARRGLPSERPALSAAERARRSVC